MQIFIKNCISSKTFCFLSRRIFFKCVSLYQTCFSVGVWSRVLSHIPPHIRHHLIYLDGILLVPPTLLNFLIHSATAIFFTAWNCMCLALLLFTFRDLYDSMYIRLHVNNSVVFVGYHVLRLNMTWPRLPFFSPSLRNLISCVYVNMLSMLSSFSLSKVGTNKLYQWRKLENIWPLH